MNKLIFTLLAFFALHLCAWSALPAAVALSPKTETVEHPTLSKNHELRIAQMKLFISLTPETYGVLRGRKLNIFERFSFNISQRRMKKMLKHYDYGDGPTTMQKISWLLKGLVFGPIAVILGYLFLKDEERELIKWAWFGFAGFAVIVAVLLLTL